VLATCFLKWACKLKCLALSGYFQMPKANNCRSETLYNLKVYVSLYCHRVLPTDTVGGARRQGPALSSNAWHSRQSRLFYLHLKGIEYVIRHSIRGHSQGTSGKMIDFPSHSPHHHCLNLVTHPPSGHPVCLAKPRILVTGP
jgi:hypothetical protein